MAKKIKKEKGVDEKKIPISSIDPQAVAESVIDPNKVNTLVLTFRTRKLSGL